jgi:hypothetical protein
MGNEPSPAARAARIERQIELAGRFAKIDPPPPPSHPFRQPLMDAIYWADANTARSIQRHIGPSEIGTDCPREIAYKLAETPEVTQGVDPWFAVLGTATHEWLSFALDQYQKIVLGRGPDNPRWLVEQRVRIEHSDFGLEGNTDVLDLDLMEVIDYKLLGNDALKSLRENGPTPTYKTQAHTYGKGWKQRGYPIRAVTIVGLPRSSFLKNLHIWSEPFDERVADLALSRVGMIDRAIKAGVSPEVFPTGGGHCQFCHFRRKGPADSAGCPGVDA